MAGVGECRNTCRLEPSAMTSPANIGTSPRSLTNSLAWAGDGERTYAG